MLESVTLRRLDGTFVGVVNGRPYHIIESEQYWEQALIMGADAPLEVAAAELSPAELLAAWRATAEVSRFQAFAALYSAGKLDDAEAAVAAAGGLTVIAWQNAQVFKRSSPMMNALAPALGLDDEALDDLFLAAALIEA